MSGSGERRRPQTPAYVYAALTVLLVVLLAAIALTARQPPPPTIAEFAPQAVEQITDESTQGFGRGAGAGRPTALPPEEAAAEIVERIDVARVRKCIGDPPRQIEDPQSPPCVPYWSGDNGGATAKGVTRDSIRIGMTHGEPLANPLVAFFNSRFEFYGRKLVAYQAGGGNNCQEKRAAAVDFAERVKGFAAGDPANGGVTCYYEELANRGSIGITVDPHLNEKYMASYHPFIWSYPMGTELMFRNIGRWACNRLGRQKARFSSDVLLRQNDRKFGIIMQTTTQTTGFDVEPIQEELAKCGQADVPFASYNHDHGSSNTQGQGATDPTLASNAVIKMKVENVTSIICLCVIFVEQYIPSAASGQNYFPEWLLSTWFFNDASVYIKAFWPGVEQRQAIVGQAFRPRQVKYEDTPVVWAMRESQPGFNFNTSLDLATAYYPYRSLLAIASGIQMAGPKLTPETFARALDRTKFPNPNHPIQAGSVGFAGDHSMTDDAAEFWWSESEQAPYPDEGPGTLCYTDGGARHRLNDWRQGDEGLGLLLCT